MQKITPFLWFDSEAEEAVNFYLSVFKNGRITELRRYGDEGKEITGKHQGSVMTIAFELDGQPFVALNGGPVFKFNEAVSFVVDCADQTEVDHYWEKLSAGGEVSQCGWLKDKYGLSWQIVPRALLQLLGDPDPIKSGHVMQAMLHMRKIDIAGLQHAHDQVA